MKTLLAFTITFVALQAHALDVGGTLIIRCGPLTQPRDKVQQAYEMVSLKLEECLQNKLNCSEYVWPQNLQTTSGEPLTSNSNVVNLWDLKRNFQYALECDDMIKENPGQEAGIIEF